MGYKRQHLYTVQMQGLGYGGPYQNHDLAF